VVEVAAERRDPVEAPVHAALEGFDPRQGRARDGYERQIAMLEMPARAVDMVGAERAADAAFLPVRPEHEMLDHELAAPVEQVGERHLATRPVEYIGLVDLHPGQLAALGTELVALARELFLLRQQRLARGDPFPAG